MAGKTKWYPEITRRSRLHHGVGAQNRPVDLATKGGRTCQTTKQKIMMERVEAATQSTLNAGPDRYTEEFEQKKKLAGKGGEKKSMRQSRGRPRH